MCLNMIRRCTDNSVCLWVYASIYFCNVSFFFFFKYLFLFVGTVMLATCFSVFVVVAIGLMSFYFYFFYYYFVEPFFWWCPNTELVVFEPLVMKAFLFSSLYLFLSFFFIVIRFNFHGNVYKIFPRPFFCTKRKKNVFFYSVCSFVRPSIKRIQFYFSWNNDVILYA